MNEGDLTLVDGLTWTASSPGRFFRSSSPNAIELASHVMCDVLYVGARCFVERVRDWWVIAADFDWMKHERYAADELFGRVVAAPYLGVNSMRSEVIVRAFASDVMTFSRFRVWADGRPSWGIRSLI